MEELEQSQTLPDTEKEENMGEAKRRQEAEEKAEQGGASPPERRLFADYDECPACKKTVAQMHKENDDMLLMLPGGPIIICSRCGNVFFLKSQIKHTYESIQKAMQSRIVDPNSPAGRAIQGVANKNPGVTDLLKSPPMRKA